MSVRSAHLHGRDDGTSRFQQRYEVRAVKIGKAE